MALHNQRAGLSILYYYQFILWDFIFRNYMFKGAAKVSSASTKSEHQKFAECMYRPIASLTTLMFNKLC